jgi:hypothetical protein
MRGIEKWQINLQIKPSHGKPEQTEAKRSKQHLMPAVLPESHLWFIMVCVRPQGFAESHGKRIDGL